MKCQRRILGISWRQFVRNSQIFALTGLPAINDVIRHRRIAVFGHIGRLQDSTPAHEALQSHVNLSLGRHPHPCSSRRHGRPRGRWIDQIRNDTSQTPADIWRQALGWVLVDYDDESRFAVDVHRHSYIDCRRVSSSFLRLQITNK